VTEPVDDWDLIRERQDFQLWEMEALADGEPTVQIINVDLTTRVERVATCAIGVVILAAAWGALGALSWAIWRVFQR